MILSKELVMYSSYFAWLLKPTLIFEFHIVIRFKIQDKSYFACTCHKIYATSFN